METTDAPQPVVILPQARTLRWMAALGVALLALALWLLLRGQPAFDAWLNDAAATADERARRTALGVAGLVGSIALLCLAVAAWLGAMAWRIRRTGMFPPRGYPVLVKTLQVHGPAARAQALQHAIGAAAAVLLGAGVLGGLFFYLPLAETLRLLR
jgi:hypothetical protein